MRYVVITLSVALWTATTAIPRLPPMDEAASDKDLTRTRAELLSAVRERHGEAVMRFVSADVLVESTESGSTSWNILANALSSGTPGEKRDASDHAYWKGLESALTLGGAFTTTRGAVLRRREFCAPYVYAAMPEPAALPESVRGEVPLGHWSRGTSKRATPSSDGRLVMRLSYALLQAPGAERQDASGKRWQSIELANDTEAFVPADAIWNPESYHVCFAKVQDRWLVSAFGAHSQI
jgi:hypothetical protein